MKRVTYCLIAICVCASVSFGAFDQEISNTYEYDVDLQSESLLVTGGGAYSIWAKGSSYVEVQSTSPLQLNVGGIADLNLDDSSSLSYFGGETAILDMRDHASAVLESGQINSIRSFQYILHPNQEILRHIEIVSKDYEFDVSSNMLTGIWMDDTSFSIQLVDQAGYDPVIENIFFTPEPVSIALFGLGAFFVRKRRRV